MTEITRPKFIQYGKYSLPSEFIAYDPSEVAAPASMAPYTTIGDTSNYKPSNSSIVSTSNPSFNGYSATENDILKRNALPPPPDSETPWYKNETMVGGALGAAQIGLGLANYMTMKDVYEEQLKGMRQNREFAAQEQKNRTDNGLAMSAIIGNRTGTGVR